MTVVLRLVSQLDWLKSTSRMPKSKLPVIADLITPLYMFSLESLQCIIHSIVVFFCNYLPSLSAVIVIKIVN